MKISKHIHSCLLIEEKGKVILIDPGNYTYEGTGLDLNALSGLDFLLITHEHPDHMSIPFIKEILQKFPNLEIITNSAVAEILKSEDISSSTTGNEFISIEEVPHEKMFDKAIPDKNILFKIFNKLTHPGDSFHFNLGTPILAIPIQAPWGSMTEAVQVAVKLKPEIIIPIHDWHWNDRARESAYKRLTEYFNKLGIKFLGLKTGQKIGL